MNKILIIEGDINNAINGFRKQLIESIISKDTLEYIASSKGYWYKYDIRNDIFKVQ